MRLKVLNGYAGIGGNRKLWEDVDVTAVEINPEIARVYQDFFQDDKVIVGDAHQYLLDHFKEFDFIWMSPPCPSHSRMRFLWKGESLEKNGSRSSFKYPDMKLYEEIIFLQHFFEGKYCVENVISYYNPLIPPIESDNHYFWTNFKIPRIRNSKRGIRRGHDNPNTEEFDLDNYEFGARKKRNMINNCVNPETGLYILDCAKGIIRKSSVNQTTLFE